MMLASLHIENVALIKLLDIDFDSGFTAITGETGAGKSILIDSINMITGHKMSKEIIRTGESFAAVSVVFTAIPDKTAEAIQTLGIPVSDGELFISRTLYSDGRSSAKIDTKTVTLSTLRSVCSHLININEQHDSFSLLRGSQISFLDSFTAKSDGVFQETKSDYIKAYSEYCECKSALDDFRQNEKDRNARIEFLKFQKAEIEGAKLKPGEEETLTADKAVLQNSEKISSAVKRAYANLIGDSKMTSAYDRLINSAKYLEDIADVVPGVGDICEKLNDFAYEVEAVSDEITKFVSNDTDDPEKALDKIETRLDTIARIKKKYGLEVSEILEHLQKLNDEINSLEDYDFHLGEMQKKADALKEAAKNIAHTLSQYRKKSALDLEKRIMDEFTFLDMAKVTFKIMFEEESLSEEGFDKVSFYISTNTGEPLKPLEAVVSGGELSRIMLAMKTVLAQSENVGTLIFDEIDTGVSGKTSRKIGINLKNLSRSCQIMCVTHSAQVASLADSHLKISKSESDNRMLTEIKELSYQERIEEIARILGGVTVTQNIIDAAKELIDCEKI